MFEDHVIKVVRPAKTHDQHLAEIYGYVLSPQAAKAWNNKREKRHEDYAKKSKQLEKMIEKNVKWDLIEKTIDEINQLIENWDR